MGQVFISTTLPCIRSGIKLPTIYLHNHVGKQSEKSQQTGKKSEKLGSYSKQLHFPSFQVQTPRTLKFIPKGYLLFFTYQT